MSCLCRRVGRLRSGNLVRGLAGLDLLSFLAALVSAALIGEAGNKVVGIPVALLYAALGVIAVALAGTVALTAGARLTRVGQSAGARQPGDETLALGSPLLPLVGPAGRDCVPPIGGLELGPTEHFQAMEATEAGTRGAGAAAAPESLAAMDLGRAKRLAQLDHEVTLRKRSVFVAAYLSITALSFGLGVEAVVLRQGSGPMPEGAKVALFAVVIGALQAAFFLTKQLVTWRLAMPEITMELRAVHMHSLHFVVDAMDHSCDICGEEIQGGESFQCKLCNFDYCVPCFKKGKKLQDWGLLRGDRGVKMPVRGQQAGMGAFFCRSLGLLRDYPLHVLGTSVCLLFNVSCRLIVPNLEGSIFDDLIHKQTDQFLLRVRFLVLYWVGQTIFQSSQRLLARLLSRRLRLDLRLRLFERLLAQDVAFFDATRAGAMAQRVEGDVEDMSRPVPILINSVLQSAILIIGAVICCLLSSPRLTVLSAACLGPLAYLTRVSTDWESGLNSQMIACEEESNAVVAEAMTNIRHVRAFSAEGYEAGRYRRILARLSRKMQSEALGDMLVENLEGSLEFLCEMLVLLFGGLAIVGGHQGALSVGGLMAFTMYWGILHEGVDAIQNMFSELAQAVGAAQRVFDLLDIRPDIPLQDGVELRRQCFRGRLSFEGVHFRYQARPERPVLQGLTLEVPAGSTCALVGRSGAGKSTLMHLLLRFYDPQQGQIKVDGIPLTGLNLKTWHELIGFVSQDTKLHYGSIRDNLTYALPWGAPAEGEIDAAVRAANCAEFIGEMDDGYDAKVGEGGVQLSGGQRQRLAIARAFLRRPRLLLLDEATSHLDAENEQLVQSAIDQLMHGTRQDGAMPGTESSDSSCSGGCTVLMIAHRLSTVRNADLIAVIHDGQVEEQGTHMELVQKTTGIYRRLVERQAERTANELPESSAVAARGKDMDKLFDGVFGRRALANGSSRRGSGNRSSGSSSGSSSSSSSSSSSGSSSSRRISRKRPQDLPANGQKTEDQEEEDSKEESHKGRASRWLHRTWARQRIAVTMRARVRAAARANAKAKFEVGKKHTSSEPKSSESFMR